MIRPMPCFNCGSRASCRHRQVEDVALPPLGRRSDAFDSRSLNGRGKGNSAGKARQQIIEGLKAYLR